MTPFMFHMISFGRIMKPFIILCISFAVYNLMAEASTRPTISKEYGLIPRNESPWGFHALKVVPNEGLLEVDFVVCYIWLPW